MERLRRRLLLVLPALAVALVLWTLITTGTARPVDTAQVLGGPSLGSAQLACQLVTSQVDDGRRLPRGGVELRLTARALGEERTWTGRSDELGYAEAQVEFAAPLTEVPWLRVEELASGTLLAEGSAALDGARWRASARRQGGWMEGREQGRVVLRLAVRDGVLAVPFPGVLKITAHWRPAATGEPERPAAGLELGVDLDGAEVSGSSGPLVTRADGSAEISLRPLEHALRLHLTAHLPGPSTANALGEWDGTLPVLPGALRAELEGNVLRIRSPVVRERAYVSLVTLERRLGGGSVPLVPDSEGGANGSWPLPPALVERLRSQPSFAVVSSEYDKRSPGAVGWPLGPATNEPRETFDVPDQLLIDGTEPALAAERRFRQARRSRAGALLALIGAALLALFWYAVGSRRQRPTHAWHGTEQSTADLDLALGHQRWRLALALLSIGLALAALAYFGATAR